MKISKYKNKTKFKSGDLFFKISKEIYDLRKFFNLTQQGLAKKIGTKQSGIARFENGTQLPSLSTLKKIADTLGIRLESPKFILLKENAILQKNSSEAYGAIGKESPYFLTTSSGTSQKKITYEK